MPESHKIRDIAQERGKTPDQLIPELMRKHGTPYKVAVELGLYANAIRHWLLTHGWEYQNGVWQSPAVSEIEE